MFSLYTVIYALALLFAFPFELRKRPEGARLGWLREKIGIIPKSRIKKNAVWVHAVSVGEALAAMPFINSLKERGFEVIVSTITDTGQKVARERLGEDRVIYLPFDIPLFFQKAIKNLNPVAFILMETELWPGAIRAMKKNSVPIFIVNGRISEKSFKNYFKVRFFMKRVLAYINAICVQDDTYAMRAMEIGAPEDKVKVTGNFKFDMRPTKTSPPAWLKALGSPVLVIGSTHRGEEALIAAAIKKLKTDFPTLKAVFVPRHPERTAEAEGVLTSEGLTLKKSTELIDLKEKNLPDIILVDTLGELFHIYSAADVAIVGGSFIPHGGQNPLEPAYWGKPIITGIHMENFPFMEELENEGGAKRVYPGSLHAELKALLSDNALRLAMGRKAKEFYKKRAGAVARTLSIFLEEVSPGGGI